MTQAEKWDCYIEYLKLWADDHKGIEFFGMSPAGFDEFEDNDLIEEE